MPELLIRPSLGDHKVLADLLTPNLFEAKRPISRLVVDAHHAIQREALIDGAQKSGTPLIVDPLTLLLQGDVDPQDPWVRLVPFARADALDDEALTSRFVLEEIIANVVEFQVDRGATVILPPYFYAERPGSPAFAASVAAIAGTARRMRADGVALPLMPVLCAQLQGFARRPGWQAALDRFAAAAVDVGPQAIGMYLSPLGDGGESYSKLLDLFVVAQRLAKAGTSLIAWRQGAYGPALVAAGLNGYECGMGVGEQANARGAINARKPKEGSGKSFAAHGIYIPALRRSVAPNVARTLLSDRRLKGRLVCESVDCCPRGVDSMLDSQGRRHAVRSRARDLDELGGIPNSSWRLNHIAKQAASAYVTATKANEVLAAAGLPHRIKTEGYIALEQTAEFLRTHDPETARDSA